MDIARGDAEHDDWHTQFVGLEGTRIGAARATHRELARDTLLRRDREGQVDETGIHDRRRIVGTHLHTSTEGALGLTMRSEAGQIVGRRTFEDNDHVGLREPRGDDRAAAADFFLHRRHREQIARRRGGVELMRRERERGHADAIIKGLGRIETGLRESREGAFRHDRVACADAETRDGFSRTRADIDEHLIGRSGLGATLVGRERGDDADEFLLRRARPDAETLGGEDAVRPATDRSEAEKAVGRDRLHQEADLIHVGREDHAWTLLLLRG